MSSTLLLTDVITHLKLLEIALGYLPYMYIRKNTKDLLPTYSPTFFPNQEYVGMIGNLLRL